MIPVNNKSNTAFIDDSSFDIVLPQAASLIESLRAFSYTLPTAIADLVDNSITAKANNIWIDFHWKGANSTISITDDGCGMTVSEITTAMRLGSRNPVEQRDIKDLGRFGLGLKTASFSQCRRVTVRSCTDSSHVSTRCWDLDYVAKINEWRLLHTIDSEAELCVGKLDTLKHGTVVLWQHIDRLTAGHKTDNDKDQQFFLKKAEEVSRYLSVVFHRLLENSDVNIFLNGHPITPWDPYLASEMATQVLPVTTLVHNGYKIEIAPYILPHHSKISKEKFEKAAGIRGWNSHQGFYVYRNHRLLVVGDWLGFGWTKDEHYKLARIRIDIPNALDHDWAIDVTKSRAVPPQGLREELRIIGERTRNEAKRVYSFRGAKLTVKADNERVLLWEPLVKNNKTFYRLNREHPLFQAAINEVNNINAFNSLIRLIEETVPLPHIAITNSEIPESMAGPFDLSSESEILKVMKQAYISLITTGYTKEDAVNRLRTIWPFELYPAVLETLSESHNYA
jgi:hypothetical protein